MGSDGCQGYRMWERGSSAGGLSGRDAAASARLPPRVDGHGCPAARPPCHSRGPGSPGAKARWHSSQRGGAACSPWRRAAMDGGPVEGRRPRRSLSAGRRAVGEVRLAALPPCPEGARQATPGEGTGMMDARACPQARSWRPAPQGAPLWCWRLSKGRDLLHALRQRAAGMPRASPDAAGRLPIGQAACTRSASYPEGWHAACC